MKGITFLPNAIKTYHAVQKLLVGHTHTHTHTHTYIHILTYICIYASRVNLDEAVLCPR
jgi:hypothetical protein